MTSPEVEVSPEVLRWAIESSGYSIEELASKIRISSTTIRDWESSTTKIRFATLEKLAKVIKRPTLALLVKTPPSEPALPEYFRRIGGAKPLTPKLRFSIRKARYFQSISKELEKNVNIEIIPKIQRASLEDVPEIIAERERKNLSITIETQIKWKDASEALKRFRSIIERSGIFIFQIAMPIAEAQAFTLIDNFTPVIVLNTKDIHERRIFSLFHEYAHILLGKAGICADIDITSESADKIEKWCDRFAASFLVPKDALTAEISKYAQREIDYRSIASLSKHFHVSKQMIFVRMNSNGFLSPKEAAILSKIFQREIAEMRARESSESIVKTKFGGAPPQYRSCISEKGALFVNLVLENANRKQITTSEALDYLSIKQKNFDKLKTVISR